MSWRCKKKDLELTEIQFQVDDMTGEELGFLMELLLDKGAVDVYFTAVQMKKSRPGVEVTALVDTSDMELMTGIIFVHSTTLGFRYRKVNRTTMEREELQIDTELGKVRKKISHYCDIEKFKYEYEDISRILRNEK